MRNGIHIPAPLVWLGLLAAGAALASLVRAQAPEAQRYLKMKRM